MKERKIANTVMKRFGRAALCTGLAVMITGGLLAGCGTREADLQQTTPPAAMESIPTDTAAAATTNAETTPVVTTPAETTPVETTALVTTPAETTPAETQPSATQSAQTQPSATQPTQTQPSATEPETTKPEATTPAHTHSYQAANTVAASCDSQGYTEYTCSCGSTVKRDYTDKLGHSYTVTQTEATCQTGGSTVHTCERCGSSYEDGYTDKLAHSMEDTTIDGCPVKKCRWCDTQEFTDATLAWMKQYAINYAVGQGYEYYPGMRNGYYPGTSLRLRTVAEFKRYIKDKVDCLTGNLLARGHEDVKDFYFDFAIEPEGNDCYCLWAYYG